MSCRGDRSNDVLLKASPKLRCLLILKLLCIIIPPEEMPVLLGYGTWFSLFKGIASVEVAVVGVLGTPTPRDPR